MKLKRAYQIVYGDLRHICNMNICIDCLIREACEKSGEYLHTPIKTVKEILFGKEE